MQLTLTGRVSQDTATKPVDLKSLKRALNRLSYYFPEGMSGLSGESDAELIASIKDFQRDNGLPIDGVVTPSGKTFEKLNAALAEQEQDMTTRYQWHCTMDDHSCSSCKVMNGDILTQPTETTPNCSGNCRCWVTPVETQGEERILSNASNAELKRFLLRYEGKERQLYLDNKGKVTIGIGIMLPNSQEAQKLPFYKIDTQGNLTNIRASASEVTAAFDLVKTQKSGRNFSASSYRKFTKIGIN